MVQAGDREVTAQHGVKTLGLRLAGKPPEPVRVVNLDAGEFGDVNGVRRGDEILAINDRPVAFLAPADMGPMLKARPCKLSIRPVGGLEEQVPGAFGGAAAQGSTSPGIRTNAVPAPPAMEPITLSAGSADSPRGVAHHDILQALTAHDAEKLREALSKAEMLGMDGPGMQAAHKALEALGGKDAVGPEEKRRQGTENLLAAAMHGDVSELKTAIEQAVELGVEGGFEQAEKVLNDKRIERARALDALVSVMEECVGTIEAAGGGITSTAILDELKRAYAMAERTAGNEDEEILGCAGRLIEFEESREKELKMLEDKVRRHAVAMERIADAAEMELRTGEKANYNEASVEGLRAAEAAEQRLRQSLQAPSPAVLAGTASTPRGEGQFVRQPVLPQARRSGGSTPRRRSSSRPLTPPPMAGGGMRVQVGGGARAGASSSARVAGEGFM
mmetsp:Transcript_160226/g.292598  ORF Transcript_160226/g.292598 Transcript_160226/m.292598 type:complete len:447 (-) Transcript_160226:11-1351(-)